MDDLRQQLTDNPQAAVTFATTKHANLQTERAATIGDADGHASVFLGSMSAGLVALRFAAGGPSQPRGASGPGGSRTAAPAQAPLARRNNPVDAAVSTRQDRRQTQIGVSAA